MNRLLRSILAVAAATLVAGSPAAAASCNGNAHDIVLSNGAASPGSGTTSTAVTFSVRYANTEGCAPSSVLVAIQGVGTLGMTGSGSSYGSGVTFTRTLTLPAGAHGYWFTATSGRKSVTLTSVSPGRVVISAPAPQPTPPPPPPPTVQPAPQPPPPPPPAATPTPAPTATPRPTSTPTESPTPAAGPSVSPGAGTAIDGWWRALQARPDLDPRPAAGPLARLAPGWSVDFDDILDSEFAGPLLAYGVTTAGGLAMFFVLLRRRAAREPVRPPLMAAVVPHAASRPTAEPIPAPEPTTSTAEAAGAEAGRLVLPPMRDLIPPLDPDLLRDPDGPAGPAPHEAGMPRWLRPSVRQARFGEEKRRRDWGD